jgi:hypothetical protein
MKPILLSLAAVAVLCPMLTAAFKPEPIPDGLSVHGAKEWHRGSIKLGDREYQAALIDMPESGFKLGHEDALLVDLNGDGKFELDMDNMVMEGATPLMERVMLAGDIWDLSLDADAPAVTLKRYEGDCGRLETSLQTGADADMCSTFGYVMADETAFMVSSARGMPATRLPTGDYEGMFVVTFLNLGKPSSQLQYSTDGKFSIEKDKTQTLLLSKPGELTVEVAERGNTLRVNRTLEAGKGMRLGSVTTTDANGKMKPPKPPGVEIRAPDTNELIAKGAMEYG